MSNYESEMPIHEEQRAVHKASLDAMSIDPHWSPELLKHLDEVSVALFESAKFEYEEGEPDKYAVRLAAMNSFMNLLTTLLKDLNR